MKLFLPTYRINSVFDLNTEFLQKENIKTIVFDADSTLIQAKSDMVDNKVIEKLKSLENDGFSLFIASNGKTNRINKAFNSHPIIAYPMCLKPLPFKLSKILNGKDKNTVALVGDQIFTDIICANLLKIKSFHTKPYGYDIGHFMKIKRKLENRILKTR